jgi:predicted alpha/beta-hydrolase family hydrolase
MYRSYGPEDSDHLVVLAPGDAGRLEDSAPTAIATGLAEAGIHVIRFASPACDARDDGTRDRLLADAVRAAASLGRPDQRLVLAGLSRGARVSASLVAELGALGLVAFAYPFHGRQDPHTHGREVELGRLERPALLFQGTRDSHGNREQVRGYDLPAHITVHWLEDANHALHPRARSGNSQAEQLARAAVVAAAFIRDLG